MKKILLLITCFLISFMVFAQSSEIDSELLDFVDTLNSEDYNSEIQKINELYDEIFKINSFQGVDFSDFKDKQIPYDDEFMTLTPSEKMKIMRQNSLVKDEMVDLLVNVQSKNTEDFKNALSIMKEISLHENILFNIFEKMLKSSNDNTEMALSLLEETQILLDNANTKLNLAETSVKLLNEALAYQERKNKRAFIAGNIIIPVIGSIAIFESIMLVANADEDSLISQKTAMDLLYTSIFVTVGVELTWNGAHLIFKWW